MEASIGASSSQQSQTASIRFGCSRTSTVRGIRQRYRECGWTKLHSAFTRLTAAGKQPKVVLVAVARKLLVLAYGVMKTRRPFDPTSA